MTSDFNINFVYEFRSRNVSRELWYDGSQIFLVKSTEYKTSTDEEII